MLVKWGEFMSNELSKRINKCLYCPYCDDSDIPNLFCKLSNELVDSLYYRYCPMNKKEVVKLVKSLDEKIENLEKENRKLKELQK